MAETPEELYQERQQRIKDVIQLKVPDRVPIWFQDLSFFPAKYGGITFEEAMYDDDKLFTAYKKTIIDLASDMYFNPGHAIHTPGDALEAVECQQVRWPGHGVSPHHSFQFVEGEYMKADEYDAFLDDPTDYAMRTYLPRVLGTFNPIAKLPPLKTFMLGYFGMPLMAAYTTPETVNALKSFYKAGMAIDRHNKAVASFQEDMGKPVAFPCHA